ncbi:MAG: hypothetical protein WAX14_11475 [Rhodococcus sp. (in: high G+C Gram-positive bacteria)]|uniref:hypothetical protein n=1 Tax=Rhodococcus sp. TaxID=1831 RepID=UPI003BB752A7
MTSIVDPNSVSDRAAAQPQQDETFFDLFEPDELHSQTTTNESSIGYDPSAGNGSGASGAGVLEPEISEGADELADLEAPDRSRASNPALHRNVSGRYRSSVVGGGFQLELRVDVDGRTPLRKLSGDYYAISGTTVTYFGSWTVDAVTITAAPGQIVIRGTARTTWSTTFNVATVVVPRRTVFQPLASATLRWSTGSGAPGAAYVCGHESAAFRTVELEQDVESGVGAFGNYHTGALPSGGPARVLSTAGAYLEAGIQMVGTGRNNTVTTPQGHIWNNASLHHAMETHFSRYRDVPQFRVWLMHAMRHEIGTGLRGIMFDQHGPERQGCASFYQAISAPTAENRREQLYVNVHELGHCFNLFHSFHKEFMDPPVPNRLGALSWMNYPQNYQPGGSAPGGAAAFWGAFPFQFDPLELTHLRHGFRNAVIMGGNKFGSDAAFHHPSGLAPGGAGARLDIRPVPARPVLGTPVVVEIRLTAQSEQRVHAPRQLHPKYGTVAVVIDRPRGDRHVHRPPLTACAEPELIDVHAGEVVPVSAYIGYDAVIGQVFEDPGTYHVQAVYTTPAGEEVVSPRVVIRVAAPRTREEDDIAELMLGSDVGMVLTLKGTDSEHLAAGTEALESVLAEHGESPMAVYAELALGSNAAREFTRIEPDNTISVRPREMDRAESLLTDAISASKGDKGLDDLTLFEIMVQLAESYESESDTDSAARMRDGAVKLARAKQAPASIVEGLRG